MRRRDLFTIPLAAAALEAGVHTGSAIADDEKAIHSPKITGLKITPIALPIRRSWHARLSRTVLSAKRD